MAFLLFRLLAAASAVLVMLAYVTCIGIAAKEGTYIGGLSFPYFSDVGRDEPAYYVFAGMITAASVLLLVFVILQQIYWRAWLVSIEAVTHKRFARVLAGFFGVLAPFGSAILSIFDTSTYPTIHSLAAYVFFAAMVFYCSCSLIVYLALAQNFEAHRRLRCARIMVMSCLAVAFLIYIPIGIAVVTFDPLSREDCLKLLSQELCDERSHPVLANMTEFFDYSQQIELHHMRSSTQFLCILSIMIFIGLSAFDPSIIPSELKPEPKNDEVTKKEADLNVA